MVGFDIIDYIALLFRVMADYIRKLRVENKWNAVVIAWQGIVEMIKEFHLKIEPIHPFLLGCCAMLINRQDDTLSTMPF